jgi:zinc protease
VAIFPRGGDPQPVLKQMQSILADAAVKGIDPALVETAKSNAIAELDFKKNSVDGLANAWSEALAFEGVDSPDSIKQAIEAVTPDAVNALAKRTFDPAHAVTAILTPESSGKPSEGKGFGGAESFASSPDKPVALPDWAAKAFAKIELPHSTIHPVSYTLPNGLRVIVQPESISDTVEVFGKIRTNQDMQSTKEDQGVADVLGGLFPFGTTSLDRLKLESALDALNAKMSAGSNFTLSIPSMHFAEGMKLLADNELHPALPPQAFGVVQQQISGVIAGQLQSPDFLFYQGINRALFPANDLQLRYPTPDTLKALTLDKVKAYYRKTFRPDLATIVIVGKVDPAQARDVVAKAFGTWKVEGPKPDVDYVAVPANRGSQLQVPDATSLQDTVQMKQTLDVFTHDDVRFALTVGNAVLGGGFYASRLYHDLRDKSGLVYNVSSAFELFPHRSTYAVTFGCDPDKVAPAAAMVVRDLKQMQDEPVAADDLQRAKSIVLRQLSLGESSFASIGQNLLSYAVENKPLDEDTIAAHHYFKMTAAQIQQAYRLHVRPDAFVIGVKGPAPK